MLEIFTCDQGTEPWFNCKLGIVSAGSFSKVLAKGEGKVRKNYMLKLAAEIITGERRETYQSSDMRRGIEQEPSARDEYSFVTGNDVTQIGFAKNNRIGASPDGLVGPKSGIEIKSVIAEEQIETVLANKVPAKHKPQIQGNMMVLDCESWDFVSYSPLIKNKNYIFIKRMVRDEKYINKLQIELLAFIRELDDMVKKMGGKT